MDSNLIEAALTAGGNGVIAASCWVLAAVMYLRRNNYTDPHVLNFISGSILLLAAVGFRTGWWMIAGWLRPEHAAHNLWMFQQREWVSLACAGFVIWGLVLAIRGLLRDEDRIGYWFAGAIGWVAISGIGGAMGVFKALIGL